MKAIHCFLAAVLTAFAAGAAAQQFVYPAKGQSPDQQKKDEAACHAWAVEQSKFDPTKPPPAPAAAPAPTTATGAVAARGQSRRQGAAAAQQQQQQASQQQQAGQQAYAKARGACLEGKGYSVK